MNSKILSSEERAHLRRWLKDGKEDQTLMNLFTRLRKSLPTLITDTRLIIQVYWALRRKNRWAGRTRDPQRYDSLLRLADSR